MATKIWGLDDHFSSLYIKHNQSRHNNKHWDESPPTIDTAVRSSILQYNQGDYDDVSNSAICGEPRAPEAVIHVSPP